MTAAVLVPLEGPCEIVEVAEGQLLGPVLGVPYVDVVRAGEGVQVAVDDEGHLRGLVANQRATLVFAWLLGIAPHDLNLPLVGPALFLGLDSGGESADAPPIVRRLIEVAESYLAVATAFRLNLATPTPNEEE